MILYHGSNIEITEIDLAFCTQESLKKLKKYSVETAFDVLYNSETFQKLTDEKTGLYFQSPNYIFSFLTNEIESGKIR
ncbi:MAG: hypothetical protein II838_13515 [Lachnospiraceae bacterium]|nr:hypothetical protein [Lachnospiraceae bacterium]